MKLLLKSVLLASLGLCSLAASAEQGYPSKPITLILGFSPGGISDGIVRRIADYARETCNAAIVIEYKPGASSAIATGFIKRTAADGYTVSLMSPSAMQVFPNLQKLPYDPNKDFTYLGMVLAQPQPMYVVKSSPFNSLNDVLAYAKANPGRFSWGTAGANSLPQILMQSAFEREKVTTTNVPFKGGADAIASLLGGHIDAVVSTDFGPLLGTDKVKLIVETGERKAVPTVKTLKELGFPLSVTLQYGIFGPAGMPAESVTWWDNLLRDFTAPPVYADFAKKYYGIPVYSSPSDTARAVQRGHAELGNAIKALGLRAD